MPGVTSAAPDVLGSRLSAGKSDSWQSDSISWRAKNLACVTDADTLQEHCQQEIQCPPTVTTAAGSSVGSFDMPVRSQQLKLGSC